MFRERYSAAQRIIGATLALGLGTGVLAACTSKDQAETTPKPSESSTSQSVDSTLKHGETAASQGIDPTEQASFAKAKAIAKLMCEGNAVKDALTSYAGIGGSVDDCHVEHPGSASEGLIDDVWVINYQGGGSVFALRVAPFEQPVDSSDPSFKSLPSGLVCVNTGDSDLYGRSEGKLCSGHGLTFRLTAGIAPTSGEVTADMEIDDVLQVLNGKIASIG